MNKTFNRPPTFVSTDKNVHPRSEFFTQAEFKGICDDKNNVTVDQQTFADTNNIYVDEANMLISRAPFKFYGDDKYIIKEWSFGAYGFRLYTDYTLKCITHPTAAIKEWPPYLNELKNLKLFAAHIEDKIFFWFAGIDITVFNTVTLQFEDVADYLYLPIHKLIINDIETDFETKNFLTDYYRKRYNYSALSNINFERHIGKIFKVSLNGKLTNNISKHIYDITVQPNQEKMLIYPYSVLGNNYHIDMVQTARSNVFLRYSFTFETIEVSFDGRTYRPLPVLKNIIGLPFLTKDGLYVIAFTPEGVAKCKLVAQELIDFMNYEFSIWEVNPYMHNTPLPFQEIDEDFTPVGYFETIDNFAYVIKVLDIPDGPTGGIYIYTEWLAGGEVKFNFYTSEIYNDTIKVHFRYIAPTEEHPDLGPVVTIFYNGARWYFTNSSGYLLKPVVGYSPSNLHFMRIPNKNDEDINNAYRLQGFFTEGADISTFSSTIEDDYITCETLMAFKTKHTMAWNSETEYFIKDLVFGEDGITYECMQTNQGQGVSNPLYWGSRLDLVNTEEIKYFSIISKVSIKYKLSTDTFSFESEDLFIDTTANKFKIMTDILTDDGLVTRDFVHTFLPKSDEIAGYSLDPERTLLNGDSIRLEVPYTTFGDKYIYKEAAPNVISSEDVILYTYDTLDLVDRNIDTYSIYKIHSEGNNFVIEEGPIKNGDFIMLSPTSVREYPATPEGWVTGDDWPEVWDLPRPAYATSQGIIFWSKGMSLPIGRIYWYGYVNIAKQVIPLSIDKTGVWYNIDGTLWTSTPSSDNMLELDETIKLGNKFNTNVPDYYSVLREHYFSYSNLLEVTADKRDNDLNLLLYLPKKNEQKMANKITNLHPLGDNIMGVFTDSEIWYVEQLTMESGALVYTRPLKSKIPVGCRDGDSIITALDGQAIIFPTERGLAAMAPQDFLATSEPSLNYLSDTIQERYYRFYNEPIESSLLLPKDNYTYSPIIKIVIYRYWIMLYRPMCRDILLFDTRNASWWKWQTPYPIKSLISNHRLYALLEVSYNHNLNEGRSSLLGVSYILTDKDALPVKEYDLGYYDDIVKDTVNGDIMYEGNRKIIKYASASIDWHILSQKLHFGQLNNYKHIQAINTNQTGDAIISTVLTTKAYRDIRHPEKTIVSNILIKDIRTFVQRFNLMHITNFEYKLENNKTIDRHVQPQFKLNSLCIKYSVKEGIR